MDIGKGLILFMGVIICLHVGCGTSKQDNYFPVKPVVKPKEGPPQVHISFVSLDHVSQDWKTYKAVRIAEGYTLLDPTASVTWLKTNKVVHDSSGSNSLNLISVTTLTVKTTTQGKTRVGRVLVVNDDQGRSRVFK